MATNINKPKIMRSGIISYYSLPFNLEQSAVSVSRNFLFCVSPKIVLSVDFFEEAPVERDIVKDEFTSTFHGILLLKKNNDEIEEIPVTDPIFYDTNSIKTLINDMEVMNDFELANLWMVISNAKESELAETKNAAAALIEKRNIGEIINRINFPDRSFPHVSIGEPYELNDKNNRQHVANIVVNGQYVSTMPYTSQGCNFSYCRLNNGKVEVDEHFPMIRKTFVMPHIADQRKAPHAKKITPSDYEKIAHEEVKRVFPGAENKIIFNTKIKGKNSKVLRQVDTLIEIKIPGKKPKLLIFEFKYRNRKIDIKELESFLGFCDDVGAHAGYMVTKEGYTKACHNNVKSCAPRFKCKLEILSPEELLEWQSYAIMPYSGRSMFTVLPPLGWVVDMAVENDCLFYIHKRGLSFNQAYASKEFMSGCIIDNEFLADEKLKQNKMIKVYSPTSKITAKRLKIKTVRDGNKYVELLSHENPKKKYAETRAFYKGKHGALMISSITPLGSNNDDKILWIFEKIMGLEVVHDNKRSIEQDLHDGAERV